MATFPTSFREILYRSGLSNIELANKLNLSNRRVRDILSGRGKMDQKEFTTISALVENLKSNEK